jgi:hypothetical protein
MKLLLLPAFCIFCISIFAQVPRNNQGTMDQNELFKKFKGTNRDTLRKQFQRYLQRRDQTNSLANKQGNIVILPQDHMPCIIPASSTMAVIPNAWKGTTLPYQPQYHPIPNPALPKQQSFKSNALDNSPGIPTK